MTRPRAQRAGPSSDPVLPLLALLAICLATTTPALAAAGDRSPWLQKVAHNLWSPWFIFGVGAQGLFFMRFVWQWIVSERRKRSTIPISFWYLSLAGASCTFVYACHQADPVFMIAQVLACVIYVRNLMLIHGRAARRRRAGLPTGSLASACDDVGQEDLPD